MPVSSLVVRVEPARRDAVEKALTALPMAEIVPTPAGDTLVVVLDTQTLREEEELFQQVGNLPGVRQVSLSYHNFEDVTDAQHAN